MMQQELVKLYAPLGPFLLAQSYILSITVLIGCHCIVGQCPRGSYIKDGVCRLCPIGQYTDEADQTQCQNCPGDQTTSGEGASDISYCNGMMVFYIII